MNDSMTAAITAIKKLQQTSSSKAKAEIIKSNLHNEDFVFLLYYACHPRLTYKVSEATLSQECYLAADQTPAFNSIFEFCECFSRQKAVSVGLIQQAILFLNKQLPEVRELYVKLLSKTLKLGVTAKTINKLIPGFFPEWEVQQAYPIEKYPLKDGVWFSVSQKLNGIRATYYKGQMIGRSGDVITGMAHIEKELEPFESLVLDGELTLREKGSLSDNEAFRTAAGIVNSDRLNKTEISFTIFDILPVEEFEKEAFLETYRIRRASLDALSQLLDGKYVKVLPSLYSGTDQSVIEPLLEQMVQEDKEGLMINLDVPYQCKRHRGILKVKRFYTMDLPILRCEEGSGRLAGTLGALVVDFKGSEVGVGSGFSDEQRARIWANREELTGVLAEVKYKEISYDKRTGNGSLQFPVFVSLRSDKTEVSYG